MKTQDNKSINIRNEVESDYRLVEEIIRKAFWNLYVPGCSEHYLAHTMRSHPDFIKELDFVIEVDGELIGNIMYTKARLVDESGNQKDIVTFGPLCIKCEYQRMGYGKMLIEHSFQKAIQLGYDVVVIFGHPSNYVTSGFESCKRYNICLEGNIYPAAMLVKNLGDAVHDNTKKWYYYDSPAMNIDQKQAEKFDESFEKMEKIFQPSQEEFYIISNSTIK